MPTNEERTIILRMIEEGKITAEEGARLLSALGEEEASPESVMKLEAISNGSRALHIRVTDNITGNERVRVDIPIGLVSFGLRFIPESVDFDVATLREAIESGYTGRVLDVHDAESNEHVEIFID